MESSLWMFIRTLKDCSDSMCVNCQMSSASAIEKMDQLAAMPKETIDTHHYFPMDDRVLLDIPMDHPEYSRLSRATVSTFQQSYSFFARRGSPDGVLPQNIPVNVRTGPMELDSILLSTKDGVIYLVEKTTEVHKALRGYCAWIKHICSVYGGMNEPLRTPSCHTVLFLPDFQHDNTHLRRSRFIASHCEDDFFLEMETGMIRKMPQKESKTDATHFSLLFETDPTFQRFHLANHRNMTPSEILNKVLRMAKSKKVKVVGYEQDAQLRHVGVIDEYIENPLDGFWSSEESDDE